MTWYFVPRILSALISIAILIVMTRVLGPAEFGRYNITLLLGTILFSFTFLWLAISIGRFHHAKEFEGEVIATVLGAAFVIAFFLFAISVAAQFILSGSWVDNLFFAVIYCIGHAIHELGTVILRQYNEGPRYAAVTLFRYAIGVIIAIALILNGGGYKSAVIGMSLGAALTGIYALRVALRRSGILVPKRSSVKAYFLFGFPLAVVSSSASFFAISSQLLLSFFAGMESVGYFAAAQSLATRTLRLPMGTLLRVIAPSVFEAQEKNGTKSSDSVLANYFSFLMLVSLPIVVTFICASDVFANLLFEPDFAAKTAGYLRVLALASFIFGLQGAYFSFAFTRSKKTVRQLGITSGLLVIHTILSALSIYLFGAQGACYAFLISGIIGLLTYYFFGRKIDPLRVPIKEFAKTMVGALTLAPFGILANSVTKLPVQVALLVLGMVSMFILLVTIRQTAAFVVWNKAKLWIFRAKLSASK